MSAADTCTPSFLRLLLDPRVRTVCCSGTGGGFDFVHVSALLPMLLAAGKCVVIHSYSFGDPSHNVGSAPFAEIDSERKTQPSQPLPAGVSWPEVRVVHSSNRGSRSYAPEVALCRFLDSKFPNKAAPRPVPCSADAEKRWPSQPQPQPHEDHAREAEKKTHAELDAEWWLYASYARDWTPAALRHFNETICRQHDADAFLCIDGGSDSLMRGDEEEGLGDPIEDAVTVCGVAMMPPDIVPIRILVSIGFGCDRFMGVTDDNSFKAIAELTRASRDAAGAIENDAFAAFSPPGKVCGYLGTLALERDSPGAAFYRELIEFAQSQFDFRSVIANSIAETSQGAFGCDVVPAALRRRVQPGQLHLTPLMSTLFAFDVRLMARRSLLCPRLQPCRSVAEMYVALDAMRRELCCKTDANGDSDDGEYESVMF